MSLLNFLLMHVFTALLPPVDPNETDYYECLGLPKKGGTMSFSSFLPRKLRSNNTIGAEEIRKAYRAKSLELHPDKVAQRRHMSPTEAAALYERVQEAYACLSDKKHRQQYHQLGCSNARYRFVQGGLAHPVALYENLTQASCLNKTRLVGLVGSFCALVLLQPILIAAKVNQSLREQQQQQSISNNNNDNSGGGPLADVPWPIILIPLWLAYAFFLLINTALVCVVDEATTRNIVMMSLCQHTCWLAGWIVLSMAWQEGLALQRLSSDNNNDDDDTLPSWHMLSIPFYLALLFRMMEHYLTANLLRNERNKCVTPEKMEVLRQEKEQQQEAAGAAGVEAHQEDDQTASSTLEELEEEYTVVTVSDAAVNEALQVIQESMKQQQQTGDSDTAAAAAADPSTFLSEEELESLKVQLSPEYEAITEAVQSEFYSIKVMLIIGIPFIALVACKCQAQEPLKSASWWLIFLPIWVHLGWQLVSSCCTCCCAGFLTVPPPTPELVVLGGSGTTGDSSAAAAAAAKSQEDADAAANAFGPPAAAVRDSSTIGSSGKREDSGSIRGSEFAPPQDSIRELKDDGGIRVSPSLAVVDDGIRVSPAGVADDGIRVSGGDAKKNDDGIRVTGDGGQSEQSQHQPETENTDDDFPGIHIDPEAFRAWQHAHAEAEQSAMERRTKAQSQCCMATFLLMMVCLVVGKLEAAYPKADAVDEEEGTNNNNIGYNAFWILFPVFLITGLLLCCCSCLIYGAGGSSLDDLVQHAKHDDDGDGGAQEDVEGKGACASSSSSVQQQPSSTSTPTVIPTPAETIYVPAPKLAEAEPPKLQSETTTATQPPPEDMNDLD